MDYSIGVDIGGTKIASGIIDENGRCFNRLELPSRADDCERMFEQVIHCIEGVLEKSGLCFAEIEGIGLGVPGKVDTKNGIAEFQNNLPWANFPLVQRIRELFPVKKVMIDNDVYMAAFGEWVDHGKIQKETFVYLTVSTGISCCTIHNGNFIRGAGFAGEVGFLPVKFDQSSNQSQSLEEAASGPGIANLAREKLKHLTENESAVSISPEQVLKDFKMGKSYAVTVMEEFFGYLARGIYSVSCLLDPEKLVIGGGVINHHSDLLHFVKDSLEQYLSPNQIDLLNRMDVSRLKGDSGLVGAGLRIHLS